jgi:hypothetical protein
MSRLFHLVDASALPLLFARFDARGGGALRVSDFVAALLGLSPRGDGSHVLRVSAARLCATLARGGAAPHGVRALAAALAAAAGGAPLPVPAARRICARALSVPDSSELNALLGEASRPHGYQHVKAEEVVDMLRGPLSGRARAALCAVWAAAGGAPGGGGGSGGALPLPLRALAAGPARALTLAGGAVLAGFGALWGPPLTSSSATVTFDEWLDYGRDLFAGVGRSEEALEALLAGAWGVVAPTWAPAGAVLPGSPAALVRTARGMWPPLGGSGRGGGGGGASPPPPKRAPGPASEASGVPLCLGQTLRREFAPLGYEESYPGALRLVTQALPAVPFGAGQPAARPLGSTFAPLVEPPRQNVAALYLGARHIRSVSGFLQSGVK